MKWKWNIITTVIHKYSIILDLQALRSMRMNELKSFIQTMQWAVLSLKSDLNHSTLGWSEHKDEWKIGQLDKIKLNWSDLLIGNQNKMPIIDISRYTSSILIDIATCSVLLLKLNTMLYVDLLINIEYKTADKLLWENKYLNETRISFK